MRNTGRRVLIVGSLLLLLLNLLLTACDDTEQTYTVQVNVGQTGTVKIFSSSKYDYADQNAEVTKALGDFVNSGQYNIISVTTHYTDEWLTGATVTYATTAGKGNHLRAAFVQSDKFDYNEKQDNVQAKLNKLRSSLDSSITTVNTVILGGYTVAAEVWYLTQ